LIPGRLGGRFIASHIRIPGGGEVADYVHFHKIRFQMIYCRRGWVRVVYEDQGPSFVMHEGDCVLQPPEIRHRVLEASPGLEVIEIGASAEHETWRDHVLDLPTPRLRPQRHGHCASDARSGRCARIAREVRCHVSIAYRRVLVLSGPRWPFANSQQGARHTYIEDGRFLRDSHRRGLCHRSQRSMRSA
jgi:quercetin dioxygenase-like cupin family protein